MEVSFLDVFCVRTLFEAPFAEGRLWFPTDARFLARKNLFFEAPRHFRFQWHSFQTSGRISNSPLLVSWVNTLISPAFILWFPWNLISERLMSCFFLHPLLFLYNVRVPWNLETSWSHLRQHSKLTWGLYRYVQTMVYTLAAIDSIRDFSEKEIRYDHMRSQRRW